MKIHYGLDTALNIKNPIVTTGTFDGVHVGHRKIIERLKSLAKANNGETVLISFTPHPRLVLFPEDNKLLLLSTETEKEELLKATGIDHLIIVSFTKEFSRLSATQWINLLIKSLRLHTLVIGYDHHFGRNREGSIQQLKQFSKVLDFNIVEIPAQDIDDMRVSSTKIRQALKEGDVKLANSFLEYAYTITGTVIEGDKRGRQIGYPTANIDVKNKLKLIPADGVYAVNVIVDNKFYKGMLNIGFRPTVDGKKHAIEVHIFNFEQDIYGKSISIQLINKIRNEIKFENIDALKAQLHKDAKEAITELNIV